MIHIDRFSEFSIEEIETNEGVKDFVIGGILMLSAILPSHLLSSNVYEIGGEKIEVTKTNKSLSKESAIKAIKKLSKDGFEVAAGDLPIDMQIKRLPDGEFSIINTAGETMSSANLMLSNLIKIEKGKSVLKLFKKTGKSVQGISIIIK